MREFGPEVANDRRPRVFETDGTRGSSGMRAIFHLEEMVGSPWMPNCTMKPEMARNSLMSVKKPAVTIE